MDDKIQYVVFLHLTHICFLQHHLLFTFLYRIFQPNKTICWFLNTQDFLPAPAFFLFLPWVCWYLLRSLDLQGLDQRMLLYCSFPWVLWFSDISACQNHLEKLLEGRLPGLSPRVGAQETVVPVSSQVMQMLGLESTLWEPPCQSLF